MRVVHVANSISRALGGISTVVLELSKAQAAIGIDVSVIAINDDDIDGKIGPAPGERIQRDGVTIQSFESQFRPLLFSTQLKRFIDRELESFDVVHVHGLYRFPVTYAARSARRRGVPYIVQTHGQLDPYLYSKSSRSVWLKRIYERAFEMPNLNGADSILFTAEAERERASFLALSAPACVIPNGIDWSRYEALPRRGQFRAEWGMASNEIVLYLGRLHHKKGLDLLIPAFRRLLQARPQARLIIAGPDGGSYADQVRGWVRDNGLGDSVKFVGMLDDQAVLQAYVDADVFVLPSYSENFGMTVVEAMACQLPVVISDQVNIHAQVTAAGCGIVVGCEEVEVSDALLKLLGDERRRIDMGAAGRQAARSRYSWSSIVGQVIDQYDAVIARKRQSAATGV